MFNWIMLVFYCREGSDDSFSSDLEIGEYDKIQFIASEVIQDENKSIYGTSDGKNLFQHANTNECDFLEWDDMDF